MRECYLRLRELRREKNEMSAAKRERVSIIANAGHGVGSRVAAVTLRAGAEDVSFAAREKAN